MKTQLIEHDLWPWGCALEAVGPDIHQGGEPVSWKEYEWKGPQADHANRMLEIADSSGVRLVSPKAPAPVIDQFLLPGEILFLPAGYGMAEPDQSQQDHVYQLAKNKYRLSNLDDYPEIGKLLRLYENHGPGTDPDAPSSERNFWWHHRWRMQRWGPTTPPSLGPNGKPHWYYGLISWSEPGPTHHYHTNLWLALAYLRCTDPRVKADTYGAGLAMALGDACYGMHRSGDHAGYFRDEGGHAFIGERKLGWWAKQTHFDGLVIWWLLSGHPLLRRAVYEHIEALRERPLQPREWVGWGERIPAWFLHNARIAWELTGDGKIRENALAVRSHVIGDLMGGNPPLWGAKDGAHSPWMACKLIRACREWGNNAMLDKAEDDLWSLVDFDHGDGSRPVPYRHAPIDWSESHWGTHPALVSMAMSKGSREANLLSHVEAQIASHPPAGFGPAWMGSGGLKVIPMILTGAAV